MDNHIFMVTGFQIENGVTMDKANLGYFMSYAEADDYVRGNAANRYKDGYNYMAIEELKPGIAGSTQIVDWLKLDDSKYVYCDTPPRDWENAYCLYM